VTVPSVLRIGLVTGEYPPMVGGVGDHTARLATELSNAGHSVEVLTGSGNVEASDARVPLLPIVPSWDTRILGQIPAIAMARGWDVLHVQYQPAMYRLKGAINVLPWVTRWRRRGRPAVVTTFHDLRVPYLFPKAGPLRTLAVRSLAAGSDGVIAVSDDDLPQLRRWRASRPEATTQHVPLGDQLSAPLPHGFERNAWRARLSLDPDTPLIGYFGLVNQSKGVRELVEALTQLPASHLVMMGERLGTADATNASYLQSVEALIQERGLAPRIHWTGHLAPPDLCAWLRTVDVVALPFLDGASLRRTSLIAAWSQGAPVVTTSPSTALPWADGSSTSARFIPAGDVSALAAALASLIGDPTSRRDFALAGQRMAVRFSWPEVIRQTVATYEAALGASGA
jgi:glycosyltransferase involved in cell wall biosynthesis